LDTVGQRKIIIDSREQRPYIFNGECCKKALPAGDYSLEGLETTIAIERKSLEDYIHTVIQGKRRFGVELKKLQEYAFAAVVIEASISDILAGDYRSEITPAALLGITCGLMHSYSPVHIVFAGDRPHARVLVEELLKLGGEKYGDCGEKQDR